MRTMTICQSLLFTAMILAMLFALTGCDTSVSASPQAPAASQAAAAKSLPPAVTDNTDIALKGLKELSFEIAFADSASDFYNKDELEAGLRKVLSGPNFPWKMLTPDEFDVRVHQGVRLPDLQLTVQVIVNPDSGNCVYLIQLNLLELATTARQPDIAIVTTVWRESIFGFGPRDRMHPLLDGYIGDVFKKFAGAWDGQNLGG